MAGFVCTSNAAAERGIHRTCGVCWFVHDGCRCYAVDAKGVVMGDDRFWSASAGLDLMQRPHIGSYPTLREAVRAIREADLSGGWGKPSTGRKRHLFRDGRSLCGGWEAGRAVGFDRDMGDPADCCKQCVRRSPGSDK